jgi:hypothetical protein
VWVEHRDVVRVVRRRIRLGRSIQKCDGAVRPRNPAPRHHGGAVAKVLHVVSTGHYLLTSADNSYADLCDSRRNGRHVANVVVQRICSSW